MTITSGEVQLIFRDDNFETNSNCAEYVQDLHRQGVICLEESDYKDLSISGFLGKHGITQTIQATVLKPSHPDFKYLVHHMKVRVKPLHEGLSGDPSVESFIAKLEKNDLIIMAVQNIEAHRDIQDLAEKLNNMHYYGVVYMDPETEENMCLSERYCMLCGSHTIAFTVCSIEGKDRIRIIELLSLASKFATFKVAEKFF